MVAASTPPLVSVLMPVYNGAAYLAEAVDSVLAQTRGDWQLIIADDGSTDATPSILARYEADPRITVIHQANAGPSAARNNALAQAQAPWVAFLDADDVWQPAHLERMLAALTQMPTAVLAFAGWQYIDARGVRLPQAISVPPSDVPRLRRDLTWRNALVSSGVVAARAALVAQGGFDAGLRSCEDWDLWLRLLPAGDFVSVPDILVRYRTHGENLSDSIETMEADLFKVHGKHLGGQDNHPSTWPLARRHAAAYAVFLTALAYLRLGQERPAREKLRRALETWPGLLELDEFYYELGCAFQPRGMRGGVEHLDLPRSAAVMRDALDGVSLPAAARRAAWGRGALALAQLALVNGDPRLGRRFAWPALTLAAPQFRWRAARLLARTLLPANVVQAVRGLKTRLARPER